MKRNGSNGNPLILLVFANDKAAYLENITRERQNLIRLLTPVAERLQFEVKELDYSTVEDMAETLNVERDRLLIFLFAGHSDTSLLQLDEGRVYVEGVVTKLKGCARLQLVFLNGCNNVGLVRALVEAEIPNVIGTRQPIGDKVAQRFSRSFFSALAERGVSINEAYNDACSDVQIPTAQQYRSLDLATEDIGQDWAWIGEFSANNWQLEDAAVPCNRLPPLPRKELPSEPFKDLYYYREKDAEIFFGRCQDVLELLQKLAKPEPIILLHGGTGVGKSSFLLAGLIPRLSARGQVQHYFRFSEYDPEKSLVAQVFHTNDIAAMRNNRLEKKLGQPEVWIIDQLEDIFLRQPDAHAHIIPPALQKLLEILHSLLYPVDGGVKVILSLRKEWFSELQYACQQYGLGYLENFLRPLTKPAVIEAIESLARTPHLYDKYQLTIADSAGDRLADQIANDILNDSHSSIAPTLQIILYQLWQLVKNISPDRRIWNKAIYLEQSSKGLLLEDHLKRQIDAISALKSDDFGEWGKVANDSGLVVDVLFAHVSRHNTAATLMLEEYDSLYSHVPYRYLLLKALIDKHLLIDPQDEEELGYGHCSQNFRKKHQTRLVHDTLAQLILIKYQESNYPGQEAMRILKYHISLNKKGHQSLLKGHEIKIVMSGQSGTRTYSEEEKTLLANSEKEIRRHKVVQDALALLVAFIALLAIFFIGVKRSNIIDF